jgi:NTP pyrophosphatase (non-canonical NTP hydrolase)
MTEPASPYSIGSETWPGLSKLIEECGEVLQVAGKIIGLGPNLPAEFYKHWDGTDVRERLTSELGDLLAAIAFVINTNDLDWSAINAQEETKTERFHTWHREQGPAALPSEGAE